MTPPENDPASASELDCPHFGDCGGCSHLTTPLDRQRREHRERVARVLGDHAAGLDLPFTDAPAAPPRHDRQRLLYPVQAPDGVLTLGLYRRGTHDVVALQSCEIQHPALTEIGLRATGCFRDHGLEPYDETDHRGVLRAFQARLATSTGELVLGVVTATADLPDPSALAADLRAAAADLPAAGGAPVQVVGIVHNVNPRRGNALVGPRTETLWGRDHLFDQVDGLSFRVHFQSFYQLHRNSDALLYRPALELLGGADGIRGQRVIDGFGGVGTFSLRLRRAGADRVDLVELHPTACADAEYNVAANHLDRVRVHRIGFESADLPPSPDLLVVDPTRAGLRPEGCAQVHRLAPQRLLYVACGLPALARDLDRLPAYRIEALRLVDLFPHTGHVEILALLTPRER